MGSSIRPDNPFARGKPELRSDNPFAKVAPAEEEAPNFLEHFGNLLGFAKDAIAYNIKNPRGVNTSSDIGSELGSSVKRAFANPGKTAKEVGTGVLDATKNIAGGLVTDPLSTMNQLAVGLEDMFVKTPLEAISGMKMSATGEVTPATAKEQADALKGTLAMITQVGIAKKMTAKALKVPGGKAALEFEAIKPAGRLYNVVKADAHAGLVSGAAYGAIDGIGDEDVVSQIVTNAIGFAPLGAALAVFGVKGYNKRIAKAATAFRETQPGLVSELAAMDQLHATANKPLEEILGNIDAIAEADNLTEAAIRSNISRGEGFVSPAISDEAAGRIAKRLGEPNAAAPVFQPSDKTSGKLKRWTKTNIGGVTELHVNFADAFDKTAYFLRKGKHPEVIDELLEQNPGLTREDVLAHGQYVRSKIKELGKEYAANPNTIVTTPLEVPKLDYTPRFGRSTFKFQMYSGPDGTRLFYPGVLHPKFAGFFETSGYLPNEVVTHGAADWIVRNVQEKLGAKGAAEAIAFKISGWWNSMKPEERLEALREGGIERDMVLFGDGRNQFTKLSEAQRKLVELVYSVKNRDEYFGFEDAEYGTTLDLEHVTSGERRLVSTEKVKRQNGPLKSEWLEHGDEKIVKGAVLDQNNFFDELYKDFSERYKVDGEKMSFDDIFKRFTNDFGITASKDVHNLKAGFVKRIRNDVLKGMDPEEAKVHSGVVKKIFDSDKTARETLATQAWRMGQESGLYFEQVPGGHRIFDVGGNTVAVVESVEDAIDVLQGRQTTLHDLAGAAGNVPPDIGNVGIKPTLNKLDRWDSFNLKGFKSLLSTNMVPAADFFRLADTAYGSQLLRDAYLPLQKALNGLKLLEDNKYFKSMESLHNAAVKIASELKMDDARKALFNRYLEALSAQEIKDTLLYRKMKPGEVTLSEKLAKQDVDKVIQYMHEVRKESNWSDIGSSSFVKAQAEMRQKMPEVADAGDNLFTATKLDVDDFSVMAILRLAKAIREPATHISRAEFENVHKITPSEKALANIIDQFYDNGVHALGIDKRARLKGYVPHAKIVSASGWQARVPGMGDATAQFAHELTRMGILGDNALIQDPIKLMNMYMHRGMYYKSGMAQAIKDAGKAIAAHPDQKGIGRAGTHYLNKIAQPDIETDIWNGLQAANNMMGMAADEGSVMAISNLAYMGLRPILAARDLNSAFGASYALFGAKFARRAFFTSLSNKYVQGLIDEGRIPKTTGIELNVPGMDFRSASVVAKKASGLAMTTSGQHWAYTKSIAGIYKATSQMVEEAVEQYKIDRKSMLPELAKAKAMEAIQVDVHGKPVEKIISDLWDGTGSWHEEVTKTLAFFNGKVVAGIYQSHNTPINWGSRTGKLLGHLGTWNANAIQTAGAALSKGTAARRAQRALRWATYNGALYAAGTAVGLDLYNWIYMPTSLRVGPIPQIAGEIGQGFQMMISNNEDTQQFAANMLGKYAFQQGIANPALPFSYAAQSFLEGYQQWEAGHPLAPLAAVGFKLSEEY